MCFRVVFDKTVIGRLPHFQNLDMGKLPDGELSAFTFPTLPVLASGFENAFLAGWGLIPSWVREKEQAGRIRSATVNARSETVHEKPSFRNSWPRKRCVFPVRGFFEPHLARNGKETWRIGRRDGDVFFLGGLYEETSSLLENCYPAKTFSLLTLAASGFLAEVHNEKKRMPLLMTGEKALLWLDRKELEHDLFDPFWQMDQTLLEGENTRKNENKSDFLKETSLFSIFN